MNFDALDDPANVAVREEWGGTRVGDGWESVEATGVTLNDLDHEEVGAIQRVADALERCFGGLLRVADDADAADDAEVGCDRERREEASKLVHAAEILDLDFREREAQGELLEEVLGILAFDQKLNAAADLDPRRRHAQRTSRLWRTAPSMASSS